MQPRKLMMTASAVALGLVALSGESMAQTSNNDLFVEQAGNGNFQFADQSAGDDNETYIEQNGDANSAGATFTNPMEGVANRNDGLIKQTGNRNIASWAFNDNNENMLRNDIGIIQDGFRNYANFILTDQGPMTDSTLFVEQTGDDNYVGSGQSSANTSFPAGNGGSAFGSSVSLPDFGTFGLVGPQNSSFPSGSATNSIYGDNNFVGLRQDGSNLTMQMTMQGSNNIIDGPGSSSQSGFNAYTGDGTFFDGDTGFASLGSSLALQEGSNNVVVIRVGGGDGNSVSFSQKGTGHTAEVYVSGSGNSATVVQ